ncbi:hypothetical protein ASF53_19265 [Methylobacterium sp. Leaf123]|uniref:hypothetical protein n=1 Tax=Methylobacterium sp. Leaf123 TaxID=1736264 RepID=UPI0006F74E0F|nr:hypothetical protein [Methylobacterium sp. Leaf123]KQQ29376.1 hypothetical protein ASF53_19265 [Methylobacterium sp. Leaf123]
MASASGSPGRQDWAAFARLFLCTALGLLAGYLTLAVLIDPYDSGRSTLFSAGAVRPQGPRTAAASRGRDPAFTGAVFGNSHIQLIEPARLTAATGIRFVQLSVPATGPGEQLALLGWFLRHHPAPQAVILSVDDYWCTDDPALANDKPFPFWLYSPDPLAYLRGLLRFSVAQEVVGRIGWLVGPRRKRATTDGWWDYEPDYFKLGSLDDEHLRAAREAPVPDAATPGQAGPDFPAADRLAAALSALPAETAVVMVFPPVYAAGLPRPGTPRAHAEAACRNAAAAALRRHGRSALIDARRERPALHDPGLFFDQTHYRHALARPLADEIAAAIVRLRGAP